MPLTGKSHWHHRFGEQTWNSRFPIFETAVFCIHTEATTSPGGEKFADRESAARLTRWSQNDSEGSESGSIISPQDSVERCIRKKFIAAGVSFLRRSWAVCLKQNFGQAPSAFFALSGDHTPAYFIPWFGR
jgi:hypothetical protein